MKISWGVKIAALYISFVIMILAMVIFSMTQDIHLVSDNYYEKEIKYQEQIDRHERTKKLSEEIKYERTQEGLFITFPKEVDINKIKGSILFYRPSDSGKDFKLPIKLNEKKEQGINLAKLDKGFWRIKLYWTMSDSEYYDESYIFVK